MRPSSVLGLQTLCAVLLVLRLAESGGVQGLPRIGIHRATLGLGDEASVTVSPVVLGEKGQNFDWVTVQYTNPSPTNGDWIGVFSPATFNSTICPSLCHTPIKYQYANYSNPDYSATGKGRLKLRLINQRQDIAIALYSGSNELVAVSDKMAFANPKAPVYPRLSQGKSWNEMTVTWTSGYSISEAVPFVEWGPSEGPRASSPAGTLTFGRNFMCGPPARTRGWRDPGFIHTAFLKELWPNQKYTYRLGHKLANGTYVWSRSYSFKASPYPGQDSLQRVVIFGDLGTGEIDGSSTYTSWQYGALNTTQQLIQDLKNIDMVLHNGDISYASGYLSVWDQFTEQIEPIASTVPYMLASGNHERDWPGTGSFYSNKDSGGECGVPTQTMFYAPTENREKYWYSTDYGMFRFCVADTELDWRPGTEQYKFLENCLASTDRLKQPWLIFLGHRVLGYSSSSWYVNEKGTYGEPMGKEALEELWHKYKVDLAFFGHVHHYERTCPVYQSVCTSQEKSNYRGLLHGTIHVVAGSGGTTGDTFASEPPPWSLYRDIGYGFVKLTAFNHSSLLFEYRRGSNGQVQDSFTLTRDYNELLACSFDNCPRTTLAT